MKNRGVKFCKVHCATFTPYTFLSFSSHRVFFAYFCSVMIALLIFSGNIIFSDICAEASERRHARSASNTIQAEHSMVLDGCRWAGISEICDTSLSPSSSIACHISPRCSSHACINNPTRVVREILPNLNSYRRITFWVVSTWLSSNTRRK